MRRKALLLAAGVFLLSFLVSLSLHRQQLAELLRFGSDSLGYYQFLPALFIEHDLQQMPWVTVLEDGRRLSIFSIGVALLQLPWFLLGHVSAVFSGQEANGYGPAYAVWQLAGSAFYLALAVRFLYLVLARRHAAGVALVAVLLLYLGTNLFYYTSFEPFMSHGYSFFLFAALLYLVERQLEEPDPLRHLLLFPLGALIVLVRPLNGVVLLLPLLYRAQGLQEVRERVMMVARMPLATAIGLLVATMLVLPQLLYWHAASGRWLLFTYGTKGEGFDLSSPHLFDLLISHQNGWFVYTPLMLAVMIALLGQLRQRGNGARTILLVWGITWYLYGSWWAWWLGGAFGYRGFIEYTALLLLPLVMLVERVRDLRTPLRRAAWAAALLLVFTNVRLSFLYRSPWDGPDWTWASFWHEMARAFFLA